MVFPSWSFMTWVWERGMTLVVFVPVPARKVYVVAKVAPEDRVIVLPAR